MKKIDVVSKISSTLFRKEKNFLTIQTQSNDINEEKQKEHEERLKKLYYIAVKTRNFEITQLVQRNNFFMIFQGVLIACIINSNNTVPLIHTLICVIGAGISAYQMQAAAGAKFWQEHWESEVSEAENRLEKFYKEEKKVTDFYKLFNKDLVEVKNGIYTKFYKNKNPKINLHFWKDNKFEADKKFWQDDYYFEKLVNYFPFSGLTTRILQKPSVSQIPIKVGRFLFCMWLITLFFTTTYGSNSYEYLKNLGLINGLPGKSITNIDIRNQKIPDRRDGFDDPDEIKKLNEARDSNNE